MLITLTKKNDKKIKINKMELIRTWLNNYWEI